MNIAVIIFDGVELVDMCGPVDVFLHANRLIDEQYTVYPVAESDQPIGSENSCVKIIPSYSITDCPVPDIIIIPGRLDKNSAPIPASDAIVDWVRKMGSNGKIILSVCVGFYTLANTGLLAGKKATTHYLSIDDVHHNKRYKDITLIKNVRYVEDGNFITTGGITSGIDGALYLIRKYNGDAVAQQVADMMVYNTAAPLPPYTILPPYYS